LAGSPQAAADDQDIFGAEQGPGADDDIFGTDLGEPPAQPAFAHSAPAAAPGANRTEREAIDSEEDIFGESAKPSLNPGTDDDIFGEIFGEESRPGPAPVADSKAVDTRGDQAASLSPEPAPLERAPSPQVSRADEPEPAGNAGPPEDAGPQPEPISPEEALKILNRSHAPTEPMPAETKPHKRQVKCACHGMMRDIGALRMDFLSGRYFCPDQLEPCGSCGQATALDFLEGDPPLCFYCSNRMPLNLDPEAEEIFRREVQPVMPIKYRLSSCRVARSPHHLAYYIKPLVGKEIILYWDRWTDTLLDDDQFN